MTKNQFEGRFGELMDGIKGDGIKETARMAGDTSSWTRNRAMPLNDVILSAIGKKALSASMEIRHYFQSKGEPDSIISKQDYFAQRKKLNFEALVKLNRNYLRNFYQGDEPRLWNGYVVLAIDGSRAEIPNSQENRETYGTGENQYGKAVARANLSVVNDVFNQFIVDIGIHHFKTGEIEEAKAQIEAVKEIIGDKPILLICDRGYMSLEFVQFLEEKGINYLIRLRTINYQSERREMESRDEIVEIAHTSGRLRALRKKDPSAAAILAGKGFTKTRIIESKTDGGWSFVTNLESKYGREAITRLYRKRWDIEKKFHSLKNKLKFESVIGKASIYVKQDCWAQVIVFNMVQDVMHSAQSGLNKKMKQKAYKYQMNINENIAIGLFKEKFIRLVIEEDNDTRTMLFKNLREDMLRNIVPVRPDLPGKARKWNYLNKYKCNQKPSF
jgi:rhodanese-related sulfurtransferase